MDARSRSYVHGTGPEPLTALTVGGVLDRAAVSWPDRDAVVVPHQAIRWSWRDLRREAQALGAGLLAQGLEPGDRVGIVAPNLAEWVAVQFGTAYAGLILVNINPAYRVGELEYALKKTGCHALIVVPEFKTSDYVAMLTEIAPELPRAAPARLRAIRAPELELVVTLGDDRHPGCLRYADLIASADREYLDRLDDIAMTLDADDPINIQFTSGTTGSPKAATLTHHNIVNNASLSAGIMRFTETDRLCIPVPMYHCFGMVLGSLLCATRCAAIVFPSAGFDAAAVLDAIETERCTALHGVPTMFIAELDEPDFAERDLSSLRTGIMAGAPCPVELMRRVMDEMHLTEITIGYGMTETGPLSTQTSIDDPPELRVTTVGRAMPHTEIKIVDEDGRIVPRGIAGELCTRGYCIMRGYWGDPEKTAGEIDAAHWIKTGDLAEMNEAGYLAIVGRLKDMIIRGGENIYPREIEEFIYTNPKVDEVEVFGVPDPKYGEQVAAWVRLKAGERATDEEIRDFCKGELAHFKIPYYIKFVDEFPMTVTGKVQKFIMREQMEEELKLAG
ncbi:MAG: AMP-binding protein [Woeseiaceae bacterium]|jgi:fatty-acyl-CoA synthase|nr:AMP-binding protein [Woeseiaceae bacterium]